MSTNPGAIVRRGGMSRTVFVISLVVVAAASGATGYFLPGFLHPSSTITLNGAGSSFVYPLISAMDSNYSSTTANIQINYQSVGSGTGISILTAKLADFGASDAPLTAGSSGQYAALNAFATPLTIPDTIGAVVVAYNLPGIAKGVNLNANVTAQIFQGAIIWWNDSRIQSLNTGVSLPVNKITVVHRADSSGTTFVFSSYLSSSPLWTLGASTTIKWPGSELGEPQNTGVATTIQSTSYSVGYVELDYALSASPAMTYAYMLNTASCATTCNYVEPTLSSTALAVSTLPSLPTNGNWTQVSLLNSQTLGAYPIVSFSYIMVYEKLDVYGAAMTMTRAQDLVNYLWYVVHGGQGSSTGLNYVKLPANVVANAEATLRLITYNGQTLHS
jgi:phosphate transport system substrate-binding protein